VLLFVSVAFVAQFGIRDDEYDDDYDDHHNYRRNAGRDATEIEIIQSSIAAYTEQHSSMHYIASVT